MGKTYIKIGTFLLKRVCSSVPSFVMVFNISSLVRNNASVGVVGEQAINNVSSAC